MKEGIAIAEECSSKENDLCKGPRDEKSLEFSEN